MTSGEDANPFTVRSGGMGSKAVSGTIHSLVPNESVYLYFAVKNPDGSIPPSYYKFVAPNGIVYKGGIAKEGKPSNWLAWLVVGISWSFTVVCLVLSFKSIAESRQVVAKSEKVIAESRQMVAKSEKQLEELKTLQAKDDKQLEDAGKTKKLSDEQLDEA